MKKYYINNEEVEENEFTFRLEEEATDYVDRNYDDILDEIYPPYQFGGFEIYASEILSKCDPVAYRCGISDEVSSRLSDFQYELENYDECSVNGVEFRIEENEAEE
jgi:hypothetical protein